MNCKPGDLAVIVGGSDGPFSQLSIGWLVQIEGAGSDWSAEGDARIHWNCTKVGGGLLPFDDPDGTVGWSSNVDIPDSELRPIRDPGDDAQDETLQWKPLPVKETA